MSRYRPSLLCALLASIVATVAVTTVTAAAAGAAVVPARLTEIASHSVLAVERSGRLRTGFAFGRHTAIVPFAGSLRLIASSGATALASANGPKASLVALDASGLDVSPLSSARGGHRAPGDAYVLGLPLGYQAQPIRPVRLPAFDPQGKRSVRVSGSLPPSFLGAPVVTRGGRLLGAVVAVGPGRWTLAPRAQLSTALAAFTRSEGGGGLSTAIVLAGALVLLLAVALSGVALARRRRQRAFAAQTRAAAAPTTTVARAAEPRTEPLVRRRDGPEETAEDFEVVVKSRERS